MRDLDWDSSLQRYESHKKNYYEKIEQGSYQIDGKNDAKTAASYIQNRVRIYANEKY
ncbi:MAG: hypothetical protein ACI4A3_07295 [Lachnospiraceae bacterium]